MRGACLFANVALGLLSTLTDAQTITVTTRVSACPASYSDKRSTTTIQSSVTVVPIPLTDDALNSGTPFIISIYQSSASGSSKRQAEAGQWLTADGNTTTNSTLATHYHINEGHLSTVSGGIVSANNSQLDQPLAAYPTPRSVETTFSCSNGSLSWDNPIFGNEVVMFYLAPASGGNRPKVLAKFAGPLTPEQMAERVTLYAQPATSPSTQPSSSMTTNSPEPSDFLGSGGAYSYKPAPVGSSSLEASASSAPQSSPSQAMASVSGYGPAPASSSLPALSGYPSHAPSSGSIVSSISQVSSAQSSMPNGYSAYQRSSFPASSSSSSPASQSTNLTPDGSCGGDNGYSCIGAYSGNCCSAYGYCGDTSDYCGDGCQSAFGECNAQSQSSSSAAMTSSTSMNAPVYGLSSYQGGPGPAMPGTVSVSGVSMASTSSSSSLASQASTSSAPAGYGPASSIPADYTPASSAPAGYGSSSSALAGSGAVSSAAPSSGPAAHSSSVGFASSSSLQGYPGATGAASGPSASYVSTPAHCPGDNGKVVQDASGIQYKLGCGYDAKPDSYTTANADVDFNDCFALCDSSQGCTGWSYRGAAQGAGSGMCYLKSGVITFVAAGSPYLLAAYRLTPVTVQSGSNPSTLAGYGGVSSSVPSSSQSPLSGYGGVSTSSTPSNVAPSSSLAGYVSPPTSSNSSAPLSSSLAGYAPPPTSSSSPVLSSSSLAGYAPPPASSSAPAPTSSSLAGYAPAPSSSSSSSVMPATTSLAGYTPAPSSSTPAAPSSTSLIGYAPAPSSSSSAVPSTSSLAGYAPAPTSSSAAQMPSSSLVGYGAVSSSTGTVPTASPSSVAGQCPAINGTIVTDNLGHQYDIYCNTDSQRGSFASLPANGNGLETCLEACDNSTGGCTSLVYAPDSTWAYGTCYLKTDSGLKYPTNAVALVAERRRGAPVSITSTSTQPTTTVASSTSSVYTGPPTPTPCTFGNDDPGTDEDDAFCEIDLPFAMYMYSASSSTTFASTNGILSLDNGTTAYDGGQLPDENLPSSAAAPFFDDLFLYATRGDNEGIFYMINEDQTTVTYTYNLSRGGTNEFYSFDVYYDSGNPGVFTYRYHSVADDVQDDGQSASVGIQGIGSAGDAVAVQYSFQQAAITSGLVVVCDTLAGTCTGSDGTSVTGTT